jgi:mRNA-degrading endonuclease RelE of RelBE toxin-antitoxin system
VDHPHRTYQPLAREPVAAQDGPGHRAIAVLTLAFAPEARAVDRNHNSDYTRFVKRVTFSPAAVRQYKRLPAAARSLLKKKMHERLALQDATEETRNRFRLRRVSPHADFELRVEPWRVFHRVQEERVVVELIGRKKGDVLVIEGVGVGIDDYS